MSDTFKSIIAGIAAAPFILIFTIGVGLACGINLHFLLSSIIITNIVGIILNKDSSYFFNIGAGLAVLMLVYNNSIGLESGSLQTFIIFAIPALTFTALSLLPVDYPLIPKRVVAILAFGIGTVIILKQLPNAFAYHTIQTDLTFSGEENSFLVNSTVNNWIQLSLAFLIPTSALIGSKFKKSHFALLIATFAAILIGYLLGYDTTPVKSSSLTFSESFQLKWNFDSNIMMEAISAGITITIVMLISFWGDFSTLEAGSENNKTSIKKSLRTVGIGNLLSSIFGIMPTNVSLTGSLNLEAFGSKNWVSKIPVLLLLTIITFVNIPDFNIPIFAFAGVLMYIGILLLTKSWVILKKSNWVDYIFTVLIGLSIILTDYVIGFIIAMTYALIYFLIKKWMDKKRKPNTLN